MDMQSLLGPLGTLVLALIGGGWLVKREKDLQREVRTLNSEKEALQEKRIADQKEWLETARRQAELQHRAVRVLEKVTGRSVTPQSRP